MGWLIAVAVVALLLMMPLGIDAGYNQNGGFAILQIGPFGRQLYPAAKNKNKKSEKSGKTKDSKKQGSQPGGSVGDFIPLVKLVLKFLNDFRGKLRVELLQLNVILGGGDPCDLGQNYGKACTAWANFQPHLESFLKIKKRDVKIQCDFEAGQTLVTARVILTITFGRVLSLGIVHGFKIIKEYINISKNRKGGA